MSHALEQKATVQLSLTCKSAGEALEFYKKALGATELYRMPTPDGGVAHAEFIIGNTQIYISDEDPAFGAIAMPEGQMASCLFAIRTDDCDAAFKQATDAGAKSLADPEDKFWGERAAVIRDPYGYRWSFGQITEELTPEEVEKRAQEFFSQA